MNLLKTNNKIHQIWLFLSKRSILFLIYFVLPLLIAWFIYAVFSASLPRNLPIGVVNLDKSTLSDEVIFSVNASPGMQIVREYDSIHAAKIDLSTAKIYALIVIPYNYERNIKLGIGAKLAFYYNAQYVLIGKSLNSAFLQVVSTLNAKAMVGKNLISSQDMQLAKAKAMPIFSQITPLYNANSNYAQFLLVLLLPCMLQILSALGMIGLLRFPPNSSKSLIIRYCFNSGMFLFWGICMLVFLKVLGYQSRGNLGLLILGLLVLILGVNGVVVFIQSLLQDMRKSIGVIAVYTAPSLAFAGVTYPQNSMNFLALMWSKFLPISSFMDLYVQQANYGGSLELGFKILGSMLFFVLFFVLGAGIYALRRNQ